MQIPQLMQVEGRGAPWRVGSPSGHNLVTMGDGTALRGTPDTVLVLVSRPCEAHAYDHQFRPISPAPECLSSSASKSLHIHRIFLVVYPFTLSGTLYKGCLRLDSLTALVVPWTSLH